MIELNTTCSYWVVCLRSLVFKIFYFLSYPKLSLNMFSNALRGVCQGLRKIALSLLSQSHHEEIEMLF